MPRLRKFAVYCVEEVGRLQFADCSARRVELKQRPGIVLSRGDKLEFSQAKWARNYDQRTEEERATSSQRKISGALLRSLLTFLAEN